MDASEVPQINTVEFLKARYFRTLDTKDWSTFESTLGDDIEVDHEALAGPKANGGSDYLTRLRADYDGAKTAHHGHMPEIRLTSANTAEGTWAMQVLIVKANGRRVLAFGHHRDSYAIRDGQWRITSTRATQLRLDES